MDNSSIDNFEQLLQQQSCKKPSALYNNILNTTKQTYKPQDVLETVYSQMKAIHLADNFTCVRRNIKDANNAKKSNFLSVNKLPVYSEILKNPNKFETQCVSDTQLINIIESAEAIEPHAGMTQEFETTFAHIEEKHTDNSKHEEEKELSPKNNSRLSNEDIFEDDINMTNNCKKEEELFINTNKNITDNAFVSLNIEKENLEKSVEIKSAITIDAILTPGTESQSKIAAKYTSKNTQANKFRDIFEDVNEDMDVDTGQCTQRSPSPVLNTKSIKRQFKTPAALVVSLESFENFENIVIPLIENNDLKTAKHLINSQILGGELCLNVNTDIMLNTNRNDSPILELKSDELQINSEDLKTPSVKQILDNIVSLNDKHGEKQNNSLKDEILFSSDEENDCICKESQDLPLTCVLETSFYEQTGVLEKTMYVAFQTASNNSIQICTDSFEKAQHILESNDKTVKEFSLTELVEKCDVINSDPEKSIHNPSATLTKDKIKASDLESKLNTIKEGGNSRQNKSREMDKETCAGSYNRKEVFSIDDNASKESSEKQCLKGFMTASNKKIKMSDKALGEFQQVLKDIALNENFEDTFNTELLFVSKSYNDEKNKIGETCNVDVTENKMEIVLNDEGKNDDKINDELLLQEFENIEMSLEEIKLNNEVEKRNDRGCKTVHDKKLRMSEAVGKTKNFSQCIDVDLKEQRTINTTTSPVNEVSSVHGTKSVYSESVIGFKTASNKNINISAQALAKTKNLFQDIEMGIDTSNGNIQNKEGLECEVEIVENINKPVLTRNEFVGFKTANNKAIKISERALSKSKNILKEIDEENSEVETIFNINQPSTSRAVFGGFKTASNKNINISDQALSESKKIFKDIEEDHSDTENGENINQLSMCEAKFVGFKTATKKDIKISKQALNKSKNIFKDIEKDNHEREITKNIIQQSTSGAVFIGFKTANNKDIKISDEAISKSKIVFKDIGEDKTEIYYGINQESNLANYTSFKTASNKNIEISIDTLSKSKNIFKDIENEMPIAINKKCKEHGFIGFKTASNKDVMVTDQSIGKSRQLFQDIDMIYHTKPEVSDKVQDNIMKTSFGGFKTANNKAVNISEEAILKSKRLFSDLDVNLENKTVSCAEENKDDNANYKRFRPDIKKPVEVTTDALTMKMMQDLKKSDDSVSENLSDMGFRGFQTANSKRVEVSRESLFASKNILDDVALNTIENSKKAFVGFKTASNKNVKVSDEALAKCMKIFDNIEDISITEENLIKSKPTESIFKGFQTGNNKAVQISKEALEKTKTLFNCTNQEPKCFGGFQTASNKTVNVSEQALVKSKQLFRNIDLENDIDTTNENDKFEYDNVAEKNEVKSPTREAFGFKTCNNKKINISDDALMKSKKLFENETINEINKTNDGKDPIKDVINIDCILNTQILNNFEESLCTEDFKDLQIDNKRPHSPEAQIENKRSGSPILLCPRAKKRKKFETPYKMTPKTANNLNKAPVIEKPASIIEFKVDYKKNKIYTLKELANLEDNKTKTIDPYILNFNLENILDFKFEGARNDLKEGIIAIEVIKKLFIEVTDKKLIPDGWLDIHLKLILWKLISYEIRFPNSLGMVCTVKNVIDQLKYRYDKELFNAERPILRKILERDDVSTKTMVLCVAGIYVDGVSVVSATNLTNIELLLTDGWYFVKATIDRMLAKLVYDGKIAVGGKLIISGAELVNCEQGIAPWEDTSSVRLSLFGNSTAPAPWHSQLGLRPGGEGRRRLSRVRVEGGRVPRLAVVLTRVYPMLYVEKLENGSTVTRSERLEHLYQMQYEAEREALIEKIYEEVEKDFSDQESEDTEDILEMNNKRKCLDSGSQIAKMMKISKDPTEFRAQLTATQVRLLEEHNCKQHDKYVEAVRCKVRDRVTSRAVIPLLRGRVAGVEGGGGECIVTKGMMSVWKPNDAIVDMFKEGAWIEVMNVVPTAIRNSEIQLSAGRQSLFRTVKCKNEEIYQPYVHPLKRKCYTIKDISENPSKTTEYNEIDTVGIIFSIDPPNRLFESIKTQFQNLYLSDIEKNMICVNFWGGIKKFGYENVLDTGQVIYCGNLQKRAGNTRKNIPQYRATEFSIFTKTPKNEEVRKMVEDINKKMFGLDRRKFCEDCLAVKQNYSVIKRFNINENFSPYRFNNSDYNLGRNKIFIETPVGIKVNKKKSDEFSLTGLDFESTFKQQDTQELSPKSLLRKKKVNEKIAKLKMYGEPPPLSPINITNKSKNATNSYKSPLISKNSVASTNKIGSVTSDINLNNDATPKKNQAESTCTSVVSKQLESSPIISMNRTYVKRNVNPVKLNFSECVAINENTNNSVDHFAEEFDGSPPLSLD